MKNDIGKEATDMISNTINDLTDYEPNDSDSSDGTETAEINNNNSASTSNSNSTFYKSSKNNTIIDTSSDTSLKLNVQGFSACDDAYLYVEKSQGPKGQGKTNFCFFCNKMQTKIARHLENVHKDEEEVKKFRFLPKGNAERKKLIDSLRRKGNFLYNVDPQFNTGNLITCR